LTCCNNHFIPQSKIQDYDQNYDFNWNKIIEIQNLSLEIQDINLNFGVDINIKDDLRNQNFIRNKKTRTSDITKPELKEKIMYRVKISKIANHKLEKDYSKYYNEDLKQRVYELYKCDFEYFKKLGYDYENKI